MQAIKQMHAAKGLKPYSSAGSVLLLKIVLTFYGCIADMVCMGVTYLKPYRKKIIQMNLRNSFPGISPTEECRLMKAYYRHICDLLVEPFILNSLKQTSIPHLVSYENASLLQSLLDNKKDIVLMASHYGNWEYLLSLPAITGYEVMAAYSPLSNRFFNARMKKIRMKYGLTLVPKADWYKTVLKKDRKKPALYIMVADQCPAIPYKHWVHFLHQKTYVQMGAERIARQTASAVLYLDVKKTARHCYSYRFVLLCEDGSAEKTGAIIEKYYTHLEKTIASRPELWLWSHRRWKEEV